MTSFSKYSQQGATLLVVLMLLVIMMVLGLAIASRTTVRTQVANGSVLQAQAEQAAAMGSDELLSILNSSTKPTIALCSASYQGQYKGRVIEASTSNDDFRKIELSWYACKPDTASSADAGKCGDNLSECEAYVITGVACFKGSDITNSNTQDGCTTRRYLQGYGMKTD